MKRFFSGLILACSLMINPVWAELIDINTATVAELQQNLKGIGKVKAEEIVKYRETHGAFTSIDEVQKVKGIGKGLFNKMKDVITVADDQVVRKVLTQQEATTDAVVQVVKQPSTELAAQDAEKSTQVE